VFLATGFDVIRFDLPSTVEAAASVFNGDWLCQREIQCSTPHRIDVPWPIAQKFGMSVNSTRTLVGLVRK